MASGGGSTKTNATTTQTPQVPSWVSQPYQDYAGKVSSLSNTTPQAVGPSWNQQQSYNLGGLLGDNTLASADLSKYMSPYTQNVIDTSLNDLNRSRQMAINGNSASATGSAGSNAWLGDRAGVADAETNRGFLDQAASLSANLRNTGYNNAQQGAMFDVNANRANIGLMNDLGAQQRQIAQENDPYTLYLRQMADQAGLLGAIPSYFTGQTTDTNTNRSENPGLLGWTQGISNLFQGVGSLRGHG